MSRIFTALFVLTVAWLPVAAVIVAARRRPSPTDTRPVPDWSKLDLDALARFRPCEHLTVVQVDAHNDQAEAAFARALADMGVDLDDPAVLHAVMAGLVMGARWGLSAPLWAGPQLGYHVNVLARRIPEGQR